MKTLGIASTFREAKLIDLSRGETTILEKAVTTLPHVNEAYRPRFHVDYIQDTKASITIVGLQRSDGGRYRFDVKTHRKDIDQLNTLSSIMELSVQYAANMTNVSDHQIVREGSVLQLFCQASGNPAPNITWTKVPENSDHYGKALLHGSTWKFTSINRTASGSYNCTADNGIGCPIWRVTEVNVTYPAKVIKLASEHEVAGKKSVNLQCEAEGNPQPAYTWSPCDPQNQACHESTLTISNVLYDAVYSCNVANGLGSDTRRTNVVIVDTVINASLFINEQCHGEALSVSVLLENLKAKIDEIFENEEGYTSTELANFRCRSAIVDLALKFNSSTKQDKVLTMLRDSANSGALKEFCVRASEVVAWRPNSSTYSIKCIQSKWQFLNSLFYET
ncbi:limbic system-associated membrane protein-like isoform X1 [Stylophora pistillata]|uniref:limbic system-associated membrane protein-like isoform X1 n=1 Tax=Stylophora pistillata TaxID=50429 RepID=UPI000C0507F8|nr:limbic system-associated membrane protein-like isoform X1 [Stylophora pistillata]